MANRWDASTSNTFLDDGHVVATMMRRALFRRCETFAYTLHYGCIDGCTRTVHGDKKEPVLEADASCTGMAPRVCDLCTQLFAHCETRMPEQLFSPPAQQQYWQRGLL